MDVGVNGENGINVLYLAAEVSKEEAEFATILRQNSEEMIVP